MKKLVSLLLTLLICVAALSSCSSTKHSPLELAKFFDEKGYAVDIRIDDEDINDFANVVGTRSKGLYCIVGVIPNNGENDRDSEKMGVFIFCESNDIAKNMKESLEDYLDSNEDVKHSFDRGIFGRDGKLIFLGCEDVWETLQS